MITRTLLPHLVTGLLLFLTQPNATCQVIGPDVVGPGSPARRPAPEVQDMRWYPLEQQPPFVGALLGGRDDPDVIYAGEAIFRAGLPPQMPLELRKPLLIDQQFQPGYFIVHFSTDIRPQHKQRLDLITGVTQRTDGSRVARWYVPNNALVSWVDDEQTLLALNGVDSVDWVGRYESGYKLDPRIGSMPLTSVHRVGRETWQLDVDLMPGHPVDNVVQALEQLGVDVLERVVVRGRSVYDVRYLVVQVDASQVLSIAGIEGVRLVQESGDGLQLHDLSGGGKLQNRQLAQDDQWDSPIVTATTFPLWLTHDLQGQGQLIGVVDTSFAWLNSSCYNGAQNLGSYPDGAIDNVGFALPNLARVKLSVVGQGGVNLKIPRADLLGGATLQGVFLEHGVNVAAAALADYYANDDQKWWEHDIDAWGVWGANYSGLMGPGIAHEAQLYATPLMDSVDVFRWEGPGEFTLNLGITLDNMASAGVCVTNHSAGIAEQNNTYTQTSVVHDTKAFDHQDMLQCMAAGNDGSGNNKLSSQAVVKNALTVGASDDVLRPEDRADFSSTGPRFDGALKPDVLAPGTDQALRQDGAVSGLVLADFDAQFGCPISRTQGTSFSSPIMAGAAALVHQYFEEGRYPGTSALNDASAALMKATLINAGHRLTGANLGDGSYPNMYQGWGEPNLSDVLDFGTGPRRLLVEDVPRAAGFLSGGDAARDLPFDVDASAERVRVTLVWTDEPGTVGSGKKLINDLDLRVTAPDGSVYRGNVINGPTGLSVTGGLADTLNNVENVILANPAVGAWVASVDPGPGNYAVGQGYALVITGQVSEGAPPPPAAAFSAAPSSGLAPLSVAFANESTGATGYAWDFGDGSTSSLTNPTHIYASTGSYTVSLTVSGASGSDTETKVDLITVDPPSGGSPPVAGFSGSPVSGSAPLLVAFQDASTGTIGSYSWDFGDGNTSSATHPSHSYAIAGSYTVSLTVSGPDGSDTETRSSYVSVGPPVTGTPPVAAFTAAPTAGAAPLIVGFLDQSTGTVTSRAWDFGDGSGSSETYALHSYTIAGTYTVSLTVSGPDGSDVLTQTDLISISDTLSPPVAEFMGTPSSGGAPLDVPFQDLSTGSVTSRIWDFGDGTISTQSDPSHTYTAPGSYTIVLTVSGPGGNDVATKIDYVTVDPDSGPAPVAGFTSSAVTGTAPLSVSFQDTTTGAVDSWTWDFGDGSSSGLASPAHTYTVPGTYTVSLTVVGPDGSDSTTQVDYVTVAPAPGAPPVAGFTSTTSAGIAPHSVAFQDLSTGSIGSRMWSFGDGTTSSLANPSHLYQQAGIYTVSLAVTGPDGSDVETKLDYVAVTAPPTSTSGRFYISFATLTVVPGLGPVDDEDVVLYDANTNSWSLYFDGSDVGLQNADVGAVHVLDNGDLLLSFKKNKTNIPNLFGGPEGGTVVEDSDLVWFQFLSAGPQTSGFLVFFFDGSDVGLTTKGEDIDGLHQFPSGGLAMSFVGPAEPGSLIEVLDEDVLLFAPLSYGADTAGTWTRFFDGDQVGFQGSGEDIDGLSFDAGMDMLFTTIGRWATADAMGMDEDIGRFSGTFGLTTTGTASLELDVSELGIRRREDIDALCYIP